jgi:hypothetical protein
MAANLANAQNARLSTFIAESRMDMILLLCGDRFLSLPPKTRARNRFRAELPIPRYRHRDVLSLARR